MSLILTAQQRLVVDAPGNFLLLACPGSGKTRATAERAARLVGQSGTKIALCSYTNVGADRLGTVLVRDLGVTLGAEHFVGTIHRFLLRYVVMPFAHLLGAERGPFLREDGSWPDVMVHGDHRQRITIDRFRFSPDGHLVLTAKPRGVGGTPEEIIASVGQQVLARKRVLFGAGALTADDAMWVALRLLRERPEVAVAVAARFDELLLDEAQDTSELQLACLRALSATGGLGSLALIGDLEQSIFSFQGASAAGCRRLAEDCGLAVMPLSENHRCSQRICDVAAHFCARPEADRAVGPSAECEIAPEVMLYSPNDPTAAIGVFRRRLGDHGIAPERSAVLARGNTMVDELNGQSAIDELKPRHHLVGRLAARLAGGTLTIRDVRAARALLAHAAWGTGHFDELDDEQRADVRSAAYGLLTTLAPPTGDLRQWLLGAREVLADSVARLNDQPAHTAGRLLPAGPRLAGHDARAVFAPPPWDLGAQTVHSLKGEDRDAVMVVIRRPHGADPTSQIELWEAVVAGTEPDLEKEEERRVLFVALTRARRYCLVALPDDRRGRAVAVACAGLGFENLHGA